MAKTVLDKLAVSNSSAKGFSTALLIGWLLVGITQPLWAQPEAPNPATRRVLILCGLPGDDEHRNLFASVVEAIHEGLTTNLGVKAEEIRVQFGSPKKPSDGPALTASRGTCLKEEIAREAAELKALKGEDALWVIVVGHTHHDGKKVWLNVPGPDLTADEFGKLFAEVNCGEQVFWVTTPVSGFFLKPLAKPGRVVISATEADLEVNETLYPTALADVLKNPHKETLDADSDGRQTLFDLYVAAARNVASGYALEKTLSTEHALIDDNGDGKGSEVQLEFLPEDQGGRPPAEGAPKMPNDPKLDGGRARAMVLPWTRGMTNDK